MERTANSAREIFSLRLREIRKQAGYKSARALAQVLGIDENRYTRYERAEVEPNLQLIVQICSKLNTSPDVLLGFATGPAHGGSITVPGFLESQPQAPFMAQGAVVATAEPERPTPDASYWHVAELVAEIKADGETDACSELQRLSAASQEFSRIKADPFGFASEIVNDPAVKQAARIHQDQLAERLSVAIQITVAQTP